jgi:alginate O-acetyltransferase complex protein AlgI
MVFSSITFLLYFFPLFLLAYYLSPRKFKNYIVLIFSVFFYAWGAPKFIFILLVSTIATFYLVKWMDSSEKQTHKRWLLGISILINIGFLAFFKYANFFVDNLNDIFQSFGYNTVAWTKIVLPIGISFYTFQTLTYAVDVYRGVHNPLNKLSNYVLYIIMFPQLVAGPIVRYNEIADQIVNRRETYNDRLLGFYRFAIGLAKKVLIANVMGAKADEILSMDFLNLDTTTAWIGILAYTFQIYFDFSGYSDMAIGIGRMIGFKFPENFDNPYISRSITEFWRRWHMTLGSWMKNYLYIPLGGNRVKTNMRLYFNLWFVFLLSGLWHGAAWNFVIWGAFHGFFLVTERLFLSNLLKKAGNAISLIYTFFITIMGWVIFRIENYQDAFVFYKRLFAFDFDYYDFYHDIEFTFWLILSALFSFFIILPYGKKLQQKIFYSDYNRTGLLIGFILSVLLVFLCVSSIATSDFNPFIYFRF